MNPNKNINEDLPLDLKHDTMEFSASTEGNDKLDIDDERYEEEAISAEELEAINDTDDNEAAALVAEQTDFKVDESNLPDEEWTDDIEKDIPEENETRR